MTRRRKLLYLMLFDIIALNGAYVLASFLRFEGDIPQQLANIATIHIVVMNIIKISTYYGFKIYDSIWEYASVYELWEIVGVTAVANIFVFLYILAFSIPYSRSIMIIISVLDILFIGGIRFLLRGAKHFQMEYSNKIDFKNVIIVGAGAAGVMTLKEIRNHRNLASRTVAFIDDDPKKIGKNINGIRILGNSKEIPRICQEHNVDEIIIAIPSAKGSEIRDIIQECKKTTCKTKILPGVYELLDGVVSVSKIRDVQIEDLLGREEIHLELEELSRFIKGKRIMITGGGGSIGSELSRQIASYSPESLLILDIYENNAYDLQNELLRKHKDLDLKVFIASVGDARIIDEIMEVEKPQIIFHAAAHKHVPLMEFNPKAAIKNNVFGTLNMVKAASKHGVNKFVMVSTDKAVNPTNVMGASKRICEMIIQSFNPISATDYVAVRFGNVLGSSGSVIPLFKKQIEEGGPVTVTDKEVVRYFMTIPEACQLILQAGSMATGGEIFVLDMGEPVRILDLAKDLIKLSGFQSSRDIPIEIIGLRPGEKLYEEILIDKENMIQTCNEKIYVEKSMIFKYKDIMDYIDLLERSLGLNNKKHIRDILKSIVPSYNPYVPEELLEISGEKDIMEEQGRKSVYIS